MEAKTRPLAIIITTWLMVILIAMGWIGMYQSGDLNRTTATMLAISSLVGGIITKSYWSGQRWARHLVLISAILIIFRTDSNWGKAWLADALQVAGYCLSLFLLFWLNGQTGRAYFRALYRDA